MCINCFTPERDDLNGAKPDVARGVRRAAAVCGRTLHVRPPNVFIEAVSRDCDQWDRNEKRWTYEAVGVEESWIADPLERRRAFLRLNDFGMTPSVWRVMASFAARHSPASG